LSQVSGVLNYFGKSVQVAPLLQVLVVTDSPLDVLHATTTEFTVAPLPLSDALLLLRHLASEASAPSPLTCITAIIASCAASHVQRTSRLIAGGMPGSMGRYMWLAVQLAHAYVRVHCAHMRPECLQSD